MKNSIISSFVILTFIAILPLSCSESVKSEEELMPNTLVKSGAFQSFAKSGKEWSSPYRSKISEMETNHVMANQNNVEELVKQIRSLKGNELNSAKREKLAILLGFENYEALKVKYKEMAIEFKRLENKKPKLKTLSNTDKASLIKASLLKFYQKNNLSITKSSDIISFSDECSEKLHACTYQSDTEYAAEVVGCAVAAGGLALASFGFGGAVAGGACLGASAARLDANYNACYTDYKYCE